MLVKAIINSLTEDGYGAYITIPILDGYKPEYVGTSSGRFATVCTLPGCNLSYNSGDVVFVEFEQDKQSEPVILGSLYREEQPSQLDIKATSLQVSVNANLSEDTSIGDVSRQNIYSLLGNTFNIDKRIENLSDRIDYIENIKQYNIDPEIDADSIFIARYRVTTADEAERAWQEGKIIFATGLGSFNNNYQLLLGERTSKKDFRFGGLNFSPDVDLFSANCTRLTVDGWTGINGDSLVGYSDYSRPNASPLTLPTNSKVNETPSAEDNSTKIATTAFVQRAIATDVDNIFIATYGTTTSAKIEAAYQAGKAVLCLYGDYNEVGVLYARVNASRHMFVTVSYYTNYGYNQGLMRNIMCNNNSWSVSNSIALASRQEMNDRLAEKQDVLTVDPVPTQNSTNPVESGGVYTALANKQNNLPSQTGNNGKYLTTNGSSLSWGDITISNEVFIAVYDGTNNTTYAEIETAMNANKFIYCYYNNRLYSLGYKSSTYFFFYAWEGNTKYFIRCSSSDVWADGQMTYSTSSHTHSTYAPINSPVLTGTPQTPNIDINSPSSQIANKAYVDAHSDVYYATCSTSATTVAKVATTTKGDFVLATGAKVTVKFTYRNSASSSATLNVDNTGDKTIYRAGSSTTQYYWQAGEVLDFVYDGTYWVMEGKSRATTTDYGITKLETSSTSTSTSTALTPSSLNSFALNTVSGLPVYSSSNTYAIGDKVRYGNSMYECNTAITTAESWHSEKWTALPSLLEQIENNNVFVASYGTTTSAQLEAAYQAGKFIYCIYSTRVYWMAYRYSATNHQFVTWYSNTRYSISCSNGTWSATVSSTAFAPLYSPDLTGVPTAPTANLGTNTTQIATTEFVQTAVQSSGGAGTFIAIYGTTTNAQLLNAYNSNQNIILRYKDPDYQNIYYIAQLQRTGIGSLNNWYFSCIVGTTLYTFTLSTSGTWSVTPHTITTT